MRRGHWIAARCRNGRKPPPKDALESNSELSILGEVGALTSASNIGTCSEVHHGAGTERPREVEQGAATGRLQGVASERQRGAGTGRLREAGTERQQGVATK